MDRQESMICVAKINRYSRQIVTAIETNATIDIMRIAPEINNVPKWGESILNYLRGTPSVGLVKELGMIGDTSRIYVYLKGNKKLKADTKLLLKEFIQTVSKLHDYAERYQKQYRKGPYEKLVEELAYKEAKDVFVRIKEAGFIDDDFKLRKSTSRVQSVVLAWSIIKILKLPKRKSWAVIERQWDCSRLSTIPLPEQRTKDIDKVKAVFPELDYSTLSAEPAEKHFVVGCGEDVLMEAFLTLVTHGFISKRTKFENFMKIFTSDDTKNFKPVEWISSMRNLCYFVHYAFGKTNSKYIERTRYCFSLKGKPLNKGTIKSTTSLSIRQDDGSETLVGLKQTALKLAVTSDSAN